MRAGDPYRSPRSHLNREITTGDDYGYCEDAMILAGHLRGRSRQEITTGEV